MKQFIPAKAQDGGGLLRLDGKDYHYLVRVRRLAPGEYFDTPQGRVKVLSTDNGVLVGEVNNEPHEQGAVGQPLILYQALAKGPKMDTIVRQAAEGGIAEIVPFESEFSVPRLGGGGPSSAGRLERWRRIIREARQQSGSAVETVIHEPVDFGGLLARWKALCGRTETKPVGILFHQIPLENGSLHGYLENAAGPVVIAVGAEGGFSPAEAAAFAAAGFRPLVIGDSVLRVETAALYAAAAVRIILLERDLWTMKH